MPLRRGCADATNDPRSSARAETRGLKRQLGRQDQLPAASRLPDRLLRLFFSHCRSQMGRSLTPIKRQSRTAFIEPSTIGGTGVASPSPDHEW